MGKAQINIHTAAAGKGLKQDVTILAQKAHSQKLNAFLNNVFEHALKDKQLFNSSLSNPREKGGSHISIILDEKTKEEIISWAKEQNSNISLWSNHIIEKYLETN